MVMIMVFGLFYKALPISGRLGGKKPITVEYGLSSET